MTDTATVQHLPPGSDDLERHRTELTAYAYRMLGSAFEAQDAVQEALVRAWRASDRFEGRSSVRSWLYRITTNVCLDMLNGRQRRARPMDMSESGTPSAPLAPPLPETTWLGPIPDSRVIADDADPADVAVARESVRLAFVAALQHLPPRQRAVLILREVLRWRATEVAELLDTTVASVNSALQRARATLAERSIAETDTFAPMDDAQQALLDRFVEAFERYDLDSLTTLLHDDVVQSMPPYPLWLVGPDNVRDWMRGPGAACEGSRLLPTVANGAPAFGQYKPSGPGGRHEPWSLAVLDVRDGVITGLTFFLDVDTLFPLFGLPMRLDDDGSDGEDRADTSASAEG